MMAILMRHGEAEPLLAHATTDLTRGLTPRGVRQVERQAKKLAARTMPARIIASPYTRAQQTAEIVARHYHMVVETSSYLTPDSTIDQFYEVLNSAMTSPILYVGHNPLFTRAARHLDGAFDGGFDPSSCAAFEFEVAARDLGYCCWQLHSSGDDL